MTLSIADLQIRIGPNGEIEAGPIKVNVRYDVTPTWLVIAMAHRAAAGEARARREAAWTADDEDAKSNALEAEFQASMQAIVAAAVCWEALYGILVDHVELPAGLTQRWRTKRVSRHVQVTEVVRRAFKLKPNGVKTLRQNLKEVYHYRDLAIHPSGIVREAIHHPELQVGTEWRFVYFRASNAALSVTCSAAMIWDLANNGNPASDAIAKYQETLRVRLTRLFPDGPPVLPQSGS
jgi:hypothetical protein